MTDWRQIVRALGIDVPPAELARTLAPLESLETAFTPLVSRLSPDDEPAVIFTALLERDAQ